MPNRYCNLVGTDKIKDTYGQISTGFNTVQTEMDGKLAKSGGTMTSTNKVTNLNADLWDGWHLYSDISELGLTAGSETMEAICEAMADKSMLIFQKLTTNLSSAYPTIAGMLTITRSFSYRIALRFVSGDNSNGGRIREWVGYYDINITPSFTGWTPVMNDTNFTDFTYIAAAVTTSQSIVTGTATKVAYNTEYSDHLAEYDTGAYRFTPKRSGVYLFNALVYLLNAPSNIDVTIMLYKNGSGYRIISYSRGSSTAANQSFGGSVQAVAAVGDYFEVYLIHNAGSNVTLGASATHSIFQVSRLV